MIPLQLNTLITESGIIEFLNSYQNYIVVGHKEPDGDCVASQMAIASGLERNGKNVILASSGPFTRTEVQSFKLLFIDTLTGIDIADSTAIIVVDCSSLDRIGSLLDSIPKNLPLAFIDHHVSSYIQATCNLIDSTAPSTTYIIQHILETMHGYITKYESGLLLLGLCTDTGFFRHLDDGSDNVFQAVSRLVSAGASPKKTFEMMYGGKTIESRKLLGELLAKANTYYNGQLIITCMTLADHEKYTIVGRDSDMLYQLFFGVAGMEVAAVIREETEGHCSIGLRAKSSVDVREVATMLGGGGHKLAAGAYVDGNIADIEKKVIDAFSNILK